MHSGIDGMLHIGIKVSQIKIELEKSVDNQGQEMSADLKQCKTVADFLKNLIMFVVIQLLKTSCETKY